MTLVEFAEFLVTKIAKETEMVKAKEFETEEGLVLEILVSENDMGKQGKMANSLKTILRAKAYNDGIKKVQVNISSF